MLRRISLPRSRFTGLRIALLFLVASSCGSVAFYWSNLTTSTSETTQEESKPWARSVALMSQNLDEINDEINDELVVDKEHDLVPDGVTESPYDMSTVEFDIEGQLQKDVLEFGEQLHALGYQSVEQEDLHVAVELPEMQPWEFDVAVLEDAPDTYFSQGLLEDDHIPGLVDDGHHHGRQMSDDEKRRLRFLPQRDALLQEELEAVARLAEEEAMKDAEDQEWAKLGDVEEAEEWKKEANVDWVKEQEDMAKDNKEEEEEIKRRQSEQMKKDRKVIISKERRKKEKKARKEEVDDDEEQDDETEETRMQDGEMTTIEPTTPEPEDEIAMEEEEEKELFNAPDTRKIQRILLKLGLTKNNRLKTALETYASKDKKILLTLCDSRYTMMALNFYENTVLKLGITNVLFMALDGRLCAKLDTLSIPCFIYGREHITQEDIDRGVKKIFNSKIYYRARMILEAITMGFTVLYSDVDTVYLRDPFTAFDELCASDSDCNVGFQQYVPTSRRLSWGVNYARPSISTLYLYYVLVRKTQNRTIALPDSFINRLDREGKLNVLRLPSKKFRSGIELFETTKFAWDLRCGGCVSIHSDETFTKDAKIYRFRELLMWNLDVDTYYTSKKRKYLSYDNPYVFHNNTETLIMEMKALRNALALGQILQRIVILPMFHCFVPDAVEGEVAPEPPVTKWCNLHDVLQIEQFHRWFMGRYREHVFLSHPKVPRPVRKGISQTYYIGINMPQDPGPEGELVTATNVTLVKPRNALYGAQSEEIRTFFNHEEAKVLRLHSLYYGFSHFLSEEVAAGFNRRIKLGFEFRGRVRYNVRKLKVKKPEPPGGAPKPAVNATVQVLGSAILQPQQQSQTQLLPQQQQPELQPNQQSEQQLQPSLEPELQPEQISPVKSHALVPAGLRDDSPQDMFYSPDGSER